MNTITLKKVLGKNMLEIEHANRSKILRIFGACKTKGFAAVKNEKFSHAPKIFNFRGLFQKKPSKNLRFFGAPKIRDFRVVDQKRLINNSRCNKC